MNRARKTAKNEPDPQIFDTMRTEWQSTSIYFCTILATGGGWFIAYVCVTMMVEILSPRMRCTAISIGIGFAYGIFDGLTPFIAT